MNLLICYTELAEYTIACVNEFIEQTGAKVHIIKWPVKDEAPFKFANLNSNITFYERNKFNDESLLELAKKIGLKPKRRIEFYTGKIDCRLFEYELYAGSREKK